MSTKVKDADSGKIESNNIFVTTRQTVRPPGGKSRLTSDGLEQTQPWRWEMQYTCEKIFMNKPSMYIAFLIAMVGFAPKPSEVSLDLASRWADCLPPWVQIYYWFDLTRSASFTLVDILHSLTFFTIFAILVVSAICLKLHDKEKVKNCSDEQNRLSDDIDHLCYGNVILVQLAATNWLHFIFRVNHDCNGTIIQQTHFHIGAEWTSLNRFSYASE